MLDNFFNWVRADVSVSWQIISAAMGLFVGGLWTALVFFQKVLSESEQKRFDRYRLLIKEINEGRGNDGSIYIAYQLDAVYELRFHRKYYSRSLWLLSRLKCDWANSKKASYDIEHLNEIDQTIDYIRHRNNLLSRIAMYGANSLSFFRLRKNYMANYKVPPNTSS
jgi:hypothetical protein